MKKFLIFFLIFVPLFVFAQVNDDFDDGEITSNPVWTGDVALFEILNPPTAGDGAINADAGNDAFVLRSLQQTGDAIITTQSNVAYGEWMFSIADGRNWSVSSTNDYKIILMSDDNNVSNLTDGNHNFNGYFLQFDGGFNDQFVLYRQTGTITDTVIKTMYPATIDGATPLGRTIKITRSASGEWSIFIDEGFDVIPTTQRGMTVTDNSYTTSNYFGIATNISTSTSDSRVLYFDNLVITPLPGNDDDSQIIAGGDTEPTTISSLVNSADGLQVFDVQLEDLGTVDGLSTIINSIAFSQGDANDVADWTDAIAGAKLLGTDLTTGIDGVVSANGISFSPNGSISVADGTTESYQLYIWLKTDLSNINDNDNLEFKLDFSDIVCDNSGSSFGSGSIESGDDNVAIDIEATQINLTNYLSSVAQNVDFSLTANATDANGNIDLDKTSSVVLTLNEGTGNLTSSTGLTQNFVSGQYTWNDLKYDVIEQFKISASSTGLTYSSTGTISCDEFVSFLNDDFEDGDIFGWTENESGHWAASDFDAINGIYSLHVIYETDVTANYSDKISHSLGNFDLTADSTVWKFEVMFTNSSPSGSNSWYVFLTSDADNSQMFPGGTVNGYVFGLNFSGSDDVLKLWNVTDGAATVLISTGFDWNNYDANVPKSIVVSRSTSGDWEVRIDEDGGFDNLISYGTAIDANFTTADYFGAVYNYTKLNSLKFWLDDIFVGPPIPDTDAPFLTDISVQSPNTLQLTFNEDVDKTSAETLTNYTVDNSIGNPNSVVQDVANHRIVDLTFASDFQSGIDYGLLIENIEDVSGNIIEDTVVSFDWLNIDIESVRFISTTELDIKFTKQIDSSSAVLLSNYSIDNSIGEPSSAVFDETERDLVHLTFAVPFQYEQSYLLHVENLEDVFGNLITPTDYNFIFYMTRRYDVIVNEIMADVNPAPIALPANKYIEIYNASNYSLDLTSWTLTIGSNNDLVFPSMNIASHEYVIICAGEAASFFAPYGQTAPILKESYLTSTSGKMITLKNASGEIIEQVTYNPDEWYGDNDKDDGGWSMERIDPINYCSQNTNWHASENYTGGSPGMINSVYGINPDTEAPHIEGVTLATSSDIIIDFSETVDTTQVTSLLNYVLNSSTIPITAVVDYDDNSIVHLHYVNHFLFSNNSLVVSNISDYCGNSMEDTTISFFYELIHPLEVEPKSATQIKVYFSEPVDKFSAENYLNYSVDNGIVNPIIVTRDANDSSVVHLLFDKEFTENTENVLTITGLSDVNGNSMSESNIVFTYHVPDVSDIVINEMMLDVNPSPLGLPDVQYVELFNTTQYDIWLTDWIFLAESQNGRVFPTVKIKANGFVILCNENDEKSLKEFGTTIPILGTSDLTQTGKELEIYDNRDNLIYHLRYSDTWYNDGEKDDGGWSLEKIDPFNFCESSFNWGASVDVSGGTPGRDNSIYKVNTDTTNIELENVIVKSSNQLVVQFSKNISFNSGLDVSNYSVAGIGNPQGVSLVDTSYSTVNLYFDTQFSDAQEYTLHVADVSDDCGNSVEGSDFSFTYYLISPEYVWVLNKNQLKVKFSEDVDYSSAMIKDNYMVDNLIGTPNYIVRGTDDPSIVFLQFSEDFTDGETYELSIADVEDVNNNVMKDATLEFVYYNAKVNDLVINEVLFNPYKGGVDFVELYNRSDYAINMLDITIAKRDDDGLIASPYRISDKNYLLQPQTYLVVTTDSNYVQETYNYGGKFLEINTMPSYPDDEGTVVIYNGKDTIIDEFKYNKDMHFGLISDQSGVSLERIDFNYPTSDTSNWHSAAESAGFATPGLVNSQYRDLSDATLFGRVSLDPQVFSPDNDGYNDQLYINYKFDEGGYVATVSIFDKNGRQVRELINDEYVGTDGFWIWDGLDDYQQKVRIGVYVVVVKVFDLDGNIQVYKVAAVVAAMK